MKLTQKNNSFVVGAFIIAISNIIVKIIGAVYKIPLDRYILGTEGMGIYSASYTIYNLLFVVSTAGLPVAISKMIAESTAKDDYKTADSIFRIARKLLFVIGLIAFAVMFFFSKNFANMINSPDSYFTTMVMAPSLLFVSIASVYRGYYQGMQNMYPTAISEIIEALSKLVFGLSVAYIVKSKFDTYYLSSAGAISGITIGTFLSVCFLIMYSKLDRNRKRTMSVWEFKNSKNSESSSVILKRLIKIAVPITIGVSVFTLTSFIDMATVMNTLGKLGYNKDLRSSLYGYLNRAITLFNMPPTVINAISISVVPFIASSLALKNKKNAISTTRSALKITLLLGLPCAVGLSVLSQPVLKLLYDDGSHSFLLTVMGLAVLFVTLVQTSNAVLQAWGLVWTPVFHMLIGGMFKIAINLILVSQPQININGAPIGTLTCYIVVMVLNIAKIKKYAKIKLGFSDFIIRPVILGIITAITAYFTYAFLSGFFVNVVSLFLSIGVTAVVYFAVLFLIKGIKDDEILLLPKGKLILDKLKKLKIM